MQREQRRTIEITIIDESSATGDFKSGEYPAENETFAIAGFQHRVVSLKA